MKIVMISAYDNNQLIGNKNKLPWHLPEDLQHFKETTLNKIIVMGKNTYLSIGKPLPNRTNVVISTTLTPETDNLFVFKNIDDMLEFYKNENEIIIIGGSSIYEQFLPYVDELIITKIKDSFEGDSYFPNFDHLELLENKEKSKYSMISKNNVNYDIITYNKKEKSHI